MRRKSIGYNESGKEYYYYCPSCKALAFHWNLEKQVGHCKKCGEVFHDPPEPLKGRTPNRMITTEEFKDPNELNPWTLPIIDYDNPYHQPAADYLQGRGVGQEDSLAAKLRFDIVKQNIYFPISPVNKAYSPSFISRNINEKVYITKGIAKKEGGYLFGLDKLEKREWIILTEGVFDVLSPGLLGRAVAIMGVILFDSVKYWLRESGYKKVIVCLDPDADDAQRKILKQLTGCGFLDVKGIVGMTTDLGDCQDMEVLVKLMTGVPGYPDVQQFVDVSGKYMEADV